MPRTSPPPPPCLWARQPLERGCPVHIRPGCEGRRVERVGRVYFVPRNHHRLLLICVGLHGGEFSAPVALSSSVLVVLRMSLGGKKNARYRDVPLARTSDTHAQFSRLLWLDAGTLESVSCIEINPSCRGGRSGGDKRSSCCSKRWAAHLQGR